MVMIVLDDFFEHLYPVKINHRLLDGKMICIGNFICKIQFLQYFIVRLFCGFFVYGFSVKDAELVGLFICILHFQHCNVKEDFLGLNHSIIIYLYAKYKILMFIIVEFYFYALKLKLQC